MSAVPEPFDCYVAVDWSGAKASGGQPGLAIAQCAPGSQPPALVAPPDGRRYWTRLAALDWLNAQARAQRVLAGFDAAFAFPFIDLSGYFPGLADSPEDYRGLWKLVESVCAEEEDLAATGFPADPRFAPYFFRGDPPGARFQRRFRLAEHLCREAGLANAQSVFHLVGANQVGKSALSIMRLLARLDGYARWPFEAPGSESSVAVEVYTALFLGLGGAGREKLRTASALARALAAFGCNPPEPQPEGLSDHESDVLVTAAGMRAYADAPALWRPKALSRRLAKTEGWVFGVS